MPGEAGFDKGDTDVPAFMQDARDEPTILVRFLHANRDVLAKDGFARESLRDLAKCLAVFGCVDPLKADANFPAVAHDADRVPVCHRDYSTDESTCRCLAADERNAIQRHPGSGECPLKNS